MKKRHLLLFILLFVLCLSACDPLPTQLQSGENSSGDYGFLGDTMSSVFFDFTITEAFSCDSYENYTAASGDKLIVATVSIQNTFTASLPMSSYDFLIQWGEGEQDYAYPVPVFSDEQLPDEYKLSIDESRAGILVFEVPADTTDYSISYLEIYDNNETGNAYFIYFTATNDTVSGKVI